MSRRNPRSTIVSLLAGLRLGMGALVLAYGAVCSSNAAEPASSAAGTPEEALVAYVTLNGGAWYLREPPDAIRPAAAVPAPQEPRRLAAPAPAPPEPLRAARRRTVSPIRQRRMVTVMRREAVERIVETSTALQVVGAKGIKPARSAQCAGKSSSPARQDPLMRVLVIDDDRALVAALTADLHGAGVDVGEGNPGATRVGLAELSRNPEIPHAELVQVRDEFFRLLQKHEPKLVRSRLLRFLGGGCYLAIHASTGEREQQLSAILAVAAFYEQYPNGRYLMALPVAEWFAPVRVLVPA